MEKLTYELKVKKFKPVYTDGKPDTYSVLLEGSTAPGVEFALTVAAENIEELNRVIPTTPGRLVEITIRPAMYGDITEYAYQPPEGIDNTYMDPEEAQEIIEALQEIPDEPEQLKPPDVNILIKELESFDYSDPDGSYEKIEKRLKERGYSTEGLAEALDIQPLIEEAPEWDPQDKALAEEIEAMLQAEDPREEDQPEALEARRRAWLESQDGEHERP